MDNNILISKEKLEEIQDLLSNYKTSLENILYGHFSTEEDEQRTAKAIDYIDTLLAPAGPAFNPSTIKSFQEEEEENLQIINDVHLTEAMYLIWQGPEDPVEMWKARLNDKARCYGQHTNVWYHDKLLWSTKDSEHSLKKLLGD